MYNNISKKRRNKKRRNKSNRNYKKYKHVGGTNTKIVEFQRLYNRYHTLSAIIEPQLVIDYNKIILTNPLDDILGIAARIIVNIIESSTYSLIPYYFLDDSVDINTQDTVVSKKNSGNCVSFAYIVLEKIKENGLDGIIIPATLPKRLIQGGYPTYGHVATVLETEDHFIIFEPAYFILIPIVVKKNGEPVEIDVNVFNAKWTLTYDNTEKKINVFMKGEILFFYNICVITNPSISVSYPINILNKRIPTVKYDFTRNLKIAHFAIRIDTQHLEGYNINNMGTDDHWYKRFDWKTCFIDKKITMHQQVNILSQWEGFSEYQCRDLNFNRTELIEMVFSIIKTEWDKIQTPVLLGGDYTDGWW